MQRKKLHPDYHVKNYVFHCLLVGDPPQALWDTARSMQELWNGMVDIYEACLAKGYNDEPKEEVQERFLNLYKKLQSYSRDVGRDLGLDSAQKSEVHDRFLVAMKKFKNKNGGVPRKHFSLRKIFIPHRAESGGLPVEWLFTDHTRKHTAILPAEEGHHHRPGYITLRDKNTREERYLGLRVLLHREFPPGALVKRTALLGTFEPSLRVKDFNGWKWRFLCTIEFPPPPALPPTGRIVGIDLGWRVRQDGLRIATLWDGHCARECILPWNMEGREERRQRAYFEQKGLEYMRPAGWKDLREFHSKLDILVGRIKTALLTTYNKNLWPEDLREFWDTHPRMRAGGIIRTVQRLQDVGLIDQPLLRMMHRFYEMRRWIRLSELRMLSAKKYLYRYLAAWLAQHYDAIGIEGLSLKKMAEKDPGDNFALSASMQYRQVAGLHLFRQYLTEAAHSRGRTIVSVASDNTTCQCVVCGEPIETGPKLIHVCANGHPMDQDVTGAINIFRGMAPRHDVAKASPPIPERLRRHLFPMPQWDLLAPEHAEEVCINA